MSGLVHKSSDEDDDDDNDNNKSVMAEKGGYDEAYKESGRGNNKAEAAAALVAFQAALAPTH